MDQKIKERMKPERILELLGKFEMPCRKPFIITCRQCIYYSETSLNYCELQEAMMEARRIIIQ